MDRAPTIGQVFQQLGVRPLINAELLQPGEEHTITQRLRELVACAGAHSATGVTGLTATRNATDGGRNSRRQ